MRLPDLAGRIALVTGSTGGIGTAVCNALLAQESMVFGLAVDASGQPAASENLKHLACDLREPRQIESAFLEIERHTNHLDYLINIAGIDPKLTLDSGTESDWDQIHAINLRSYYLVIRRATPLLRKGRGRSIVNISSINYRLGIPRRSIYSASKAGILGLTTGLARELGQDEIRINTVSPGWVFTPKQVEEYFTQPEDRAKYLRYLHDRHAIRRHISPEDIAQHILFYLSEASAASTGHNCVVDGGWLLE